MSSSQRLILLAYVICLAVTLLGLIARRHYRACFSFGVYISVTWLAALLLVTFPERFFSWDYWILSESLTNVAKFAVALELSVRTFRTFPGARATARRTLLVVVLLTYVAMVSLPVEMKDVAIVRLQT